MAESRTDNLLSQILGKLLKHTFLLLSVVLILVAILVLVFKDKENISFTVLLALGAAFLPLGIREGFFEDQIRSLFTKELADTGLKITEEIAGKLSSIVKTGVVKVFSRRAYGVEEFLANNFCPEDKKLDAKDKYLVIAGSSLKGLIGTPWLNNEEESDECQDGKGDEIKCKKKQDEKLNAGEEVKGKQDEKSDSKKKDKGKQNNNDDFWSTANEFRIKLVQALDESWRVRILMTHPAFGDLRAVAEVRTALFGDILDTFAHPDVRKYDTAIGQKSVVYTFISHLRDMKADRFHSPYEYRKIFSFIGKSVQHVNE